VILVHSDVSKIPLSCDEQDGGAGDAVDDDDDEEEDAEETALEGYETVLDKVDSPEQEFQMFRGTLFSMLS